MCYCIFHSSTRSWLPGSFKTPRKWWLCLGVVQCMLFCKEYCSLWCYWYMSVFILLLHLACVVLDFYSDKALEFTKFPILHEHIDVYHLCKMPFPPRKSCSLKSPYDWPFLCQIWFIYSCEFFLIFQRYFILYFP